MSRLYYAWRWLTGRLRACRVEDGYCLTHSTSGCAR